MRRIREGGANLAGDQRFGCLVGVRDEIDGPLELDITGQSQALSQERSGIARRRDGQQAGAFGERRRHVFSSFWLQERSENLRVILPDWDCLIA